MKLSTLQSINLSDAKEFEFTIPTEGSIFISIYSIESKTGKQAQMNMYRELAELRDLKDEAIKEEKFNKARKAMIIDLIADIKGLKDDKDKDIKYTKEVGEKLILNSANDLIFDFVNLKSGYMGNFLTA